MGDHVTDGLTLATGTFIGGSGISGFLWRLTGRTALEFIGHTKRRPHRACGACHAANHSPGPSGHALCHGGRTAYRRLGRR